MRIAVRRYRFALYINALSPVNDTARRPIVKNNQNQDNQQQNDQNQDQKQDQQSNPDKQEQGNGNEQQQPQGGISPQEREAMLEAIQAQEDKTQEKVKEKQGVVIFGNKNW